jgi:hypothetical protein
VEHLNIVLLLQSAERHENLIYVRYLSTWNTFLLRNRKMSLVDFSGGTPIFRGSVIWQVLNLKMYMHPALVYALFAYLKKWA